MIMGLRGCGWVCVMKTTGWMTSTYLFKVILHSFHLLPVQTVWSVWTDKEALALWLTAGL